MLNIFTDWKQFEFEFSGKNITAELKPMEQLDLFVLMAINPESKGADQVQAFKDIFGRNVRNIQGLSVNSKPATTEDIATHAALMPLSNKIMEKLTAISSVQDEDKKK